MQITLVSFGFKHGVPADIDLLLDCRFLANPYWDPELRPLTGLDEAVQDHRDDSPLATEFVKRTQDLLDFLSLRSPRRASPC